MGEKYSETKKTYNRPTGSHTCSSQFALELQFTQCPVCWFVVFIIKFIPLFMLGADFIFFNYFFIRGLRVIIPYCYTNRERDRKERKPMEAEKRRGN